MPARGYRLPPLEGTDWQQQSDILKQALRNPANFLNHGRGGIEPNLVAAAGTIQFVKIAHIVAGAVFGFQVSDNER